MKFALSWSGKLKTREMKIMRKDSGFTMTELMVTIAVIAILASLAIMIWHFYEIHFRPHKSPLDNLWITGVINEAEMKEEYMLHYKKIMNDPELQKIFIKENPKRGPES